VECGRSHTAWLAALVVSPVIVTGCMSIFLVLQLDKFRPKVGDIVAFPPRSQDSDLWQSTIPATVVSAMGSPVAQCSLDPKVMAQKGAA
jgi:hypothetical protein